MFDFDNRFTHKTTTDRRPLTAAKTLNTDHRLPTEDRRKNIKESRALKDDR
jgi:hypothetical protein